jgi:hypothetical protein
VSDKYYCHQHGWVSDVGNCYTLPVKAMRDTDLFCSKCRRQVYMFAPEHVAEMTARIAHLEALIADAPHEEWCNVVLTGPRQDCDCWKSRALDTGSKG